MGRVIEWAVVIFAGAVFLTISAYLGAAFLLWDVTPFSLRAARGVFLVGLVSGFFAALSVERERKEKKG